MPLAKDMTNQAKQDFPVDAVLNGGSSMANGESLQTQIKEAPFRALSRPVITGWKDAAGKPYSTSVAQQLAFNAQALATVNAQLKAQGELIQQVVNAISKGVDVEIDYARIEKMMPQVPEYKLTPMEAAK